MPKECDYDCYPLYKRIIPHIRQTAMKCGYAIGMHGTLKRDIDLIAVPWTDAAVSARELLEAVVETLNRGDVNGGAFIRERSVAHEFEDCEYHRAGCPGAKPHGRLGWIIYLMGKGHIDLSVMPRKAFLFAPLLPHVQAVVNSGEKLKGPHLYDDVKPYPEELQGNAWCVHSSVYPIKH